MLDYLKQRNIPTTASATKIYSRDRNLWHISHEGGAIEDPWNAPPEDAWMLTAEPAKAPDKPRTSPHLRARAGRRAQRARCLAWQIIEKLNGIGGARRRPRRPRREPPRRHEVPRALRDPGGTVHRRGPAGLEELVLDRETRHYREHLGLTFAELVYDGRWFTPLREALWACARRWPRSSMARSSCASTRARDRRQRKSPNSLYAEKMVSFEGEDVYSQKDAGGFIKLLSACPSASAPSRRFADARTRVNICPLGSGALAGTAYQVDRELIAKTLGFSAPTRNSLDAVSDRDFVIETLAASALAAAHLSRLGEDLVLYSSQEFAFIEMDDAVASGSSLMPQKKNPDAAELIRGKAGRINGALMALLTTVKGLPLAYNKDLQEDKEPLFDAMDNLSLSLRIVPRMIDTLKIRRETCRKAAAGGYSNATDLADYLVSRGVPFRQAHEEVGMVVRHAIGVGKPIEQLPLEELCRFAPSVEADVFAYIAIEAGMARREVPGATGPIHVARAIDAAKKRL
jgi:hypothetical protein